jgi:hypothetical protein
MKLLAALACAAIFALPRPAHAQLAPNEKWYTIETTHFRVHFSRGLNDEGRRAAVAAERAFAELSTELKPPHGKVDLVIADNIDYVNGYASTFPSNRIVVFAHPPIDAPELRNYSDWTRLVITHELTHIFHGDRADGLWRLGRNIFGRHPALFPNFLLPSWVVEGLATYYESRITGAGRLEGSEHYMLARAAAEANRVPRIGELSRVTSRFPGGEVVYAYGAFLLDYLSRTRGADKIPKFVDETSRHVFPLSLNAKAKRAFGISFENAWRDWRDSLVRVSKSSPPLPDWRELTHEGRLVAFPRWIGDTALIYTAATGKEVTAAYTVGLSGEPVRIGRRNSLDANVIGPDGTIYFIQSDYVDPFHYRNDLYVSRGGTETRLTRGARVTHVDVARNGDIVAVQSVPGTTILVRISPQGAVTPLTPIARDVQWADPRYSPSSSEIAAVRVKRGGVNEIVVLDARTGAETWLVTSERAILSSPSWNPAGTSIVYTSTRSGSPQVYITARNYTLGPLTAASTGLSNPEISPGLKMLAGIGLRFDGYHLGVGSVPAADLRQSSDTIVGMRARCRTCYLSRAVSPPLSPEQVPAPKKYSPWQSLLPRYWEPVFSQSSGDGFALGAATNGYDIIGRHSYFAQGSYNTDFNEVEGFFAYQYAGLGQPYLNFSAEQVFDNFNVFADNNDRLGDLQRRKRIFGLSSSFTRPRARTFASLVLGGELESRYYATDPDTLLHLLDPRFSETRNYPSLFVSGNWANTQRPSLSISREDGISVGASVRQRWLAGDFENASRSVVGVTALYKSLDLPGFAHHVVALRGAGGIADDRAITTFSAGGLSGGSLGVLEGLSLGGERRTFGVRGFPSGSEEGIRALAGTAEYRAPIAAPTKRIPFVPLLFDRISVAAFGEAARAFCPASAAESPICQSSAADAPWLASVGAEIDFDTAIQYDFPARFRLGLAVPVAGRAAVGADRASLYLTVGSSF